jgi:HK97 family phage major capsid protein
MNPIKQWSERRTAIINQADAIIRQATVEKRDLNASESESLARMKSDILEADTQIARHQSELNRSMPQSFGSMPDLQNYSITRAINGAASGRFDGYEREISDELARRSGKPSSGGFHLPIAALVERRGMTATGGSNGDQGGLAISTQTTDILSALRPYSRVIEAGATTLSGLISNISVPRANAASTASWVAENEALPDVSGTLNQLSLQPNRIGAYVILSNMLLAQTSDSVSQYIKTDLLNAIAGAIDAAAINGSGLENEPMGLLAAASGIGSVIGGVDGAAPSWSNIVSLVSTVADANADFGRLAFMSNAKVAGKLRSTAKVSSTDSVMVLEGTSLLNYPFLVSGNVPSNLDKGQSTGICSGLIFGNWQDLVIAQWGESITILVDQFSLATTGQTRIIASSLADIGIRRAASFAAMKDALTA